MPPLPGPQLAPIVAQGQSRFQAQLHVQLVFQERTAMGLAVSAALRVPQEPSVVPPAPLVHRLRLVSTRDALLLILTSAARCAMERAVVPRHSLVVLRRRVPKSLLASTTWAQMAIPFRPSVLLALTIRIIIWVTAPLVPLGLTRLLLVPYLARTAQLESIRR